MLHILKRKESYGFPTYRVRAYCGEDITINRLPFWHATEDAATWNVQEFLRNNPNERCFASN